MEQKVDLPRVRGTLLPDHLQTGMWAFASLQDLNGNIGSLCILSLSAFRVELMPSVVLFSDFRLELEQHHSGSPLLPTADLRNHEAIFYNKYLHIYSIGSVSLKNSYYYVCSLLSFLHYTSLSNTLNNSYLICFLAYYLFSFSRMKKISQRAYSLIQGWHQVGTQ